MNFFKNRRDKSTAAVQTVSPCTGEVHPFTPVRSYKPLSGMEIELYESLKEAVPIIDAAISKIVRLVGGFSIECSNSKVEPELNRFIENVQVNTCSQGASSFILTHLNQLITYGTAIGEMVVNQKGDDIYALYNASLRNIELKIDRNPLMLKVCRKLDEDKLESIKYPELVLVSALNPDPGNIYGNSIMKGLPFISNILLKIYNSIGVNWERVGNVRFAVTYKPPTDMGERAYAKERASQIASEWSRAMKNTDRPSDFVAVGDVNIKVIGADNQILDSQVPVRQMLEQIVSKLSIPPFLLGLSWSTTETMSTQQSDILTSELESYRRALNPIIQRICNMWMRLNGYQTEVKVVWDNINLRDELKTANSRLIMARAMEIEQRITKNEA